MSGSVAFTVTNAGECDGTYIYPITGSVSGSSVSLSFSGTFCSSPASGTLAGSVSGNRISGTYIFYVDGSYNDSGTFIMATSTTNYTLTISKSGSGTGTITSNTTGINCGSICSGVYITGTPVTLTATADYGSTFAGWSGGGCSGTGRCSVTMNSTQTVTAIFNTSGSSNYTLTILPSGTGRATITSSPSGIDCGRGSTCSYLFSSGASV